MSISSSVNGMPSLAARPDPIDVLIEGATVGDAGQAVAARADDIGESQHTMEYQR